MISQTQKDKCTTLFPDVRNPDLFRKKKDVKAGGFCRRQSGGSVREVSREDKVERMRSN